MEEKKTDYTRLLSNARIEVKDNKKKKSAQGDGSGTGGRKIEPFYSDRSRILYCAAFRRLQQKAQVFSMETNSNVRSRLTHSLEVSDLGRRLAEAITAQLKNEGAFTDITAPVVVSIVENACLLHDIGNPPFGHFGEAAIQDWAKKRAKELMPAGVKYAEDSDDPAGKRLYGLMADFREFDGNPQGFRTVTRLYSDFGDYGLNLTYATLLCGLKYARTTGEVIDPGQEPDVPEAIVKKAGYFQTEKDLVEKLRAGVNLPPHRRYPLTYIMEAADDIAYCMSDIADGIEKRMLTVQEFTELFAAKWEETYEEDYPREIAKTLAFYRKKKRPVSREEEEWEPSFNRDFSVPWSIRATKEAVETYMKDHDALFQGKALPLMDRGGEMCKVLKTIRTVCGEKLYPSIEAESIELTGYAVISGILRHYERIMELKYEDFERLVFPAKAQRKHEEKEKQAGRKLDQIKLDVERRLYNRFGKNCVKAYKNAVDTLDQNDPEFTVLEWWHRAHLLIDHISSMTDAFALETYQMLEGIALMKT